MSTLYDIARQRAESLLNEIGLLKTPSHFSSQLSRYILSIPIALPLQHIILGERPYGTNIHPYVSSAMSFDPDVEMGSTPSVHFLALGISNVHDISYKEVHNWFRDSWKYLNHGILVLNVCTFWKFTDNESERERVAIESFIKDMIKISIKMKDNKIHMYAMGNPAKHSSNRIRSSIKDAKKHITVHGMSNPAQYQHRCRDQWSPEFTLDSKQATKLLYNIILSTYNSNRTLSFKDYDILVSNMSDERQILVQKLGSFANVFEEAENFAKGNSKRSEDEQADLYRRIKTVSRELVSALSAAQIKLLFETLSEPKSTSKPSFFNRRQDYNKTTYSRGAKSTTSSIGSTPAKDIGMVSDDEESDSNQPSTPTPATKQTSSTPSKPQGYRAPSVVGSTFSSYIDPKNTIPEDSSEDEYQPPVKTQQTSVKSPTLGTTETEDMNGDEINDMSFVSSFLDETEEFKISPTYAEFLNDAIKARKATNEVAKEVLNVIRTTRDSSGQRSIMNALGYEKDGVDMTSNIMQWVQSIVGK